MAENADEAAGWAKAIDAWTMVAIKAGLIAIVVVVLRWPDALPLLRDFAGGVDDFKVAGVEVHFSRDVQAALAKFGLVLDNGKLLLGGTRIDDLLQNNAQLVTQVTQLSEQNKKMAGLLQDQAQQAQQKFVQLSVSGSAEASDPAVIDAAVKSAATAAIAQKAQSTAADAQTLANAVAKPDAPSLVPSLGYAIVFSSDQDNSEGSALDQAMDEVKKVQAFWTGGLTIYHRGPYLASVANFGTRADAFKALPQFSAKLPNNKPFVVNVGVWCPQPQTTAPANPPIPEQKSCGF